VVESNARLGGHFPQLKSLFCPLKDGYDASKMLSHECILINDTHDQISRGAI